VETERARSEANVEIIRRHYCWGKGISTLAWVWIVRAGRVVAMQAVLEDGGRET
jgi:hypothetical protein